MRCINVAFVLVLVWTELVGLAAGKRVCPRIAMIIGQCNLFEDREEHVSIRITSANLRYVGANHTKTQASSLIWVQFKKSTTAMDVIKGAINRLNEALAEKDSKNGIVGLVVEWCDSVSHTKATNKEWNQLFSNTCMRAKKSFLVLVNSLVEGQKKESISEVTTKKILRHNRKRFLETYWMVRGNSEEQTQKRELSYWAKTTHRQTQVLGIIILDNTIETIDLHLSKWSCLKISAAHSLSLLLLHMPFTQIESIHTDKLGFISVLDICVADWYESLQKVFVRPELTLGLELLRVESKETDSSNWSGIELIVEVRISCLHIQKITGIKVGGLGGWALPASLISIFFAIISQLVQIIGLDWGQSGYLVKIGLMDYTMDFAGFMQSKLSADIKDIYLQYSQEWTINRLNALKNYGRDVGLGIHRIVSHELGAGRALAELASVMALDRKYFGQLQGYTPTNLSFDISPLTIYMMCTIKLMKIMSSIASQNAFSPNQAPLAAFRLMNKLVYVSYLIRALLSHSPKSNTVSMEESGWDMDTQDCRQTLTKMTNYLFGLVLG
ncbi:hypothetical protein NEHOM01_2127 [Nematocida homosporus]|uniref:uncharacterized protein n=1 Tax=Nematocida homosporus TaxID=1912981 RepID=UPI002220C0E5|nr:uncharacterized protein NEHOM01_2127 [Nematocida homosporus]KAI5187373.1 hypothetical protein NEHOM01_2127 [Nematocida homosporus]